MSSMVSQVVQVLDEGSPFLRPGRILKSRVKKLQPRRRPIRPSKTTGEGDEFDRHKEQQRKLSKTVHPTTPLKWDAATKRWNVRLADKEEIENKYQLNALHEISLRAGAISVYLAKVKQYANEVDKGVTKMRSLASQLTSASTPELEKKITGELWKTDAYVLQSLRKMDMYSALVSASGGLGAPKETAKLIKKQSRTRKR
jgi:hypothetical protein